MDYKELNAWKNSINLVKKIYKISQEFPSEELYGLTSQIRRSAISIPSNIAEGSARGDKEFIHFLNIALGSLSEIETQLIIAYELSYMDNNKEIFNNITDVRKLLLGLRKHLKNK